MKLLPLVAAFLASAASAEVPDVVPDPHYLIHIADVYCDSEAELIEHLDRFSATIGTEKKMLAVPGCSIVIFKPPAILLTTPLRWKEYPIAWLLISEMYFEGKNHFAVARVINKTPAELPGVLL